MHSFKSSWEFYHCLRLNFNRFDLLGICFLMTSVLVPVLGRWQICSFIVNIFITGMPISAFQQIVRCQGWANLFQVFRTPGPLNFRYEMSWSLFILVVQSYRQTLKLFFLSQGFIITSGNSTQSTNYPHFFYLLFSAVANCLSLLQVSLRIYLLHLVESKHCTSAVRPRSMLG